MSRLCPICNYIGKGKNDTLSDFFTANIYGAALSIAIGLGFVVRESILDLKGALHHVVGYFFIMFGVFNLLNYFSNGKTCPKCGHKEMLPLDNPEAIILIKKYDLKVGENPSPITQTESSTNSLETPKL
ncbi:MAG: hypothetical protein AB1598_13905 [Thermodesulfobacteriota bacterium]